MQVYQTDGTGFYIGPVNADRSPLEPSKFLIPGGAVTSAPPTLSEGQRARWAGDAWEVVEPEPQPEPEPEPTAAELLTAERDRMQCSPLQMRRALRMTERKAAVDTYIASQPDDVQETWEFALVIRRTDPLMVAAIALLGTDEEGDDLFRLAMTL